MCRFLTIFSKNKKNLGLDTDPDWIRIQQEPGSGSETLPENTANKQQGRGPDGNNENTVP
jgi:hypothetical protein